MFQYIQVEKKIVLSLVCLIVFVFLLYCALLYCAQANLHFEKENVTQVILHRGNFAGKSFIECLHVAYFSLDLKMVE